MFYTYLYLRNNGTPYYVGKGHGKRAYKKHGTMPIPTIDRMVFYIAKDEAEALENEIALIWYYGRKDLGIGCLRNLTDGGENPPNAKGRILSNEHKRKVSEAHKGRAMRPRGYSHTKETKEKMRHKHIVKMRTHCIRGHALIPDNLRANGRSCALCEVLTQKVRRLRYKTQ